VSDSSLIAICFMPVETFISLWRGYIGILAANRNPKPVRVISTPV